MLRGNIQGHSLRGDVAHSCLRTRTCNQCLHSQNQQSPQKTVRISIFQCLHIIISTCLQLAIKHRSNRFSQCSNMQMRPCLNSTDRRRLKEYRLPSEERPNGSQKPKGACWRSRNANMRTWQFAAQQCYLIQHYKSEGQPAHPAHSQRHAREKQCSWPSHPKHCQSSHPGGVSDIQPTHPKNENSMYNSTV